MRPKSKDLIPYCAVFEFFVAHVNECKTEKAVSVLEEKCFGDLRKKYRNRTECNKAKNKLYRETKDEKYRLDDGTLIVDRIWPAYETSRDKWTKEQIISEASEYNNVKDFTDSSNVHKNMMRYAYSQGWIIFKDTKKRKAWGKAVTVQIDNINNNMSIIIKCNKDNCADIVTAFKEKWCYNGVVLDSGIYHITAKHGARQLADVNITILRSCE